MWMELGEALTSSKLWSNLVYLLVGAIVGVLYSLRAQKPRLIVNGSGGGGRPGKYRWNLTITNRPSFLGRVLDGESARDVSAHIRLAKHRQRSYPIYWDNATERTKTIEPGQAVPLMLFTWEDAESGYFIADETGSAVARFHDPELRFIVSLNDRLGRTSEFRVTVEFDESHLKQTPDLRFVVPVTAIERYYRAKGGAREFLSAFRLGS